MNTLGSELSRAKEALGAAGVDTPQLDAEVLMSHVIGQPRAYLIAHPDEPLTEPQASVFRELIERRARREPLAYITGEKEFWGLSFEVTPAVLVPRPETETLVEVALAKIRGLDKPMVIDVGTGSGCIAVAIAAELPKVLVFATELSQDALEVARRNVAKHHMEDHVIVREGDLLAQVPSLLAGKTDAIVSNPPYIPSAEIDSLQPEVALFEPKQALDGGPDGLQVVLNMIQDAANWLKPGGWVHIEVGAGQAAKVAGIAQAWGFREVEITKDLSGIDRVVSCQLTANG